MALKPCRDCQREVSVGTRKCLHCGAYFPAPPSWPKPSTIWGKVGLGLLIFILVITGPPGWFLLAMIPHLAQGWRDSQDTAVSKSVSRPDDLPQNRNESSDKEEGHKVSLS